MPCQAFVFTGVFHNLQPNIQTLPLKAARFFGPIRPSFSRLLQTKPISTRDQVISGSGPPSVFASSTMRKDHTNHRLITIGFHCMNSYTVAVTDHLISLPLDRSDFNIDYIDVYFSIVEKVESHNKRKWLESLTILNPSNRAKMYVELSGLINADGLVLYLQGGPGFGAPTPAVGIGLSPESSWAAHALNYYTHVVLMDQRGTGRSTPVTKQSLEARFPDLFALDDHQQESVLEDLSSHPDYARVASAVRKTTTFMTHFRGDNIVWDAEDIREALLLPVEEEQPRPWGCVLGQSYGGFCLMTYLGLVQHPPLIALLTGGIAPILTQTYDVYRMLWDRVKERTLKYYEMYPDDVSRVKQIVGRLMKNPVTLPSGGKLTARRFLQLGISLGGSPSSFASLHTLLASALTDNLEWKRSFLKQVDMDQPFDDAPIYFWLHESIYCNGPAFSPSNWTAHRAYEDLVKSVPEFDYIKTCNDDSNDPVLFFGEMVFPWMVEDYAQLSGVGLSAVAQELAAKTDWEPLWDQERMRASLKEGKSRAAAAVYYEDMYVEFKACEKVMARDGPLGNCKVWVTNEYQHSGLRDGGASIFAKLHGMATGKIRTPS